MSPIRVVFMGSDSFSVPALDRLILHGRDLPEPAEVVGVVTQPDRPAGRGRRVEPTPVKVRAAEAGVDVLQPERLRDDAAVREVLDLHPDLVVVASYGQILPRPILEVPRYRALNLHPSLLPRYRGPSPIVAPILAGDTVTGTTLMLMRPKMDAGPMLGQLATPVGPEETGGELHDRLAVLSAELLEEKLPGWIEGRIEPVEQDETKATYTRRLERQDLELDWMQPATNLARAVRAFAPRPGAHTHWRGLPVRILKARAMGGEGKPGRVLGMQGDGLAVGTGAGILLAETLQLPGGRALPAPDVVRGHPVLLQACFERNG